MIISGGENVYPAELEEVIGRHPRVLEVGVIGRESEKWGESPVAIVVRSDESLEGEEVLANSSTESAPPVPRRAEQHQPVRARSPTLFGLATSLGLEKRTFYLTSHEPA